MGKITIWETNCKKCNSRVIHYSTTVDLDISGSSQEVSKGILRKAPALRYRNARNPKTYEEKSKPKTSIVHCVCSGENEQGKHNLTYKFPDEFEQVK